MFTAVLATSLLALSVRVAGQATPLQLQGAQANFQQSRLVPDLLTSFTPSAVLTVAYNGTGADIGRPLTVDQVRPTPTVTVLGGGNFSSQGTFTVAMVDPGTVGADQSAGQTRHWLVNGVTLSGSGPYTLNFPNEAITAYGGPFPAEGSGPHRYTLLLLPQPSTFAAPDGLNAPGVPISTFDFNAYVTNSGLQAPVAGFYYTVEQGTASFSISPTSAVQSSTLPAASAASSAPASASAAASSGSARASGVSASAGSASARASASASAAGTSGAGKQVAVGSGALAGLVGLVALLL